MRFGRISTIAWRLSRFGFLLCASDGRISLFSPRGSSSWLLNATTRACAASSRRSIDLLSRADWLGNVRELQNEIERAVALATDGEAITADHLSPALRPDEVSGGAATLAFGRRAQPGRRRPRVSVARARPLRSPRLRATTSLQDARAAYEARYISQVLSEHGGNVSHAALALRVSRVALQKKMKRYGLR